MYIDFDGHHSDGSSFDMYMIFGFCYKMWAIPTGTSSALKKKSLNLWSGTPNSVRIRQSGLIGIRGVTSWYQSLGLGVFLISLRLRMYLHSKVLAYCGCPGPVY